MSEENDFTPLLICNSSSSIFASSRRSSVKRDNLGGLQHTACFGKASDRGGPFRRQHRTSFKACHSAHLPVAVNRVATLSRSARWSRTRIGRRIERTDRHNALSESLEVRDQLAALAAEWQVEELMIVTVVHDPAARLRSYELLAAACGLTPRT